jgi:hypothetical protein
VKFVIGSQQGINFKVIRRELEVTQYLNNHYEEFKKFLIDQGRPKDKVEQMPHVQVALLVEMNGYEQMMDEQIKWLGEPYYKIADRLDQLDKARKAQPKGISILPEEGLNYLVPAVGKIFAARARLQRKVDILRCVEAIRAYAAAHDGGLPATLDAIKDVPIPIDPVTGKAFAYTIKGETATLAAPAITRENKATFVEVAYEIAIKR